MKDTDETLDAIKISDAADLGIRYPTPEDCKLGQGRDPSGPWMLAMFRRGRRDDDDDDPPPCPAVIAPFPRLPPLGAEAELEAA